MHVGAVRGLVGTVLGLVRVLIVFVGGSVARLPGDLENLKKSENLKTTKI